MMVPLRQSALQAHLLFSPAAALQMGGLMNPARLADATRFVEAVKRRLFMMVDAMKRDLGEAV